VGQQGDGPREVFTDREGHYELLGLAKGQQYVLEVKPADGLYFRRPTVVCICMMMRSSLSSAAVL
jgi:hypothetical protein